MTTWRLRRPGPEKRFPCWNESGGRNVRGVACRHVGGRTIQKKTQSVLCRAVKAEAAEIPVILVTALWDVKNLLEGLAAGADYYFLKPLNRGPLLALAGEIMNGNATGQEAAECEPSLMYRFDGEDHAIPHSRRQILKLLISSHESTIREKTKSLADYRDSADGA